MNAFKSAIVFAVLLAILGSTACTSPQAPTPTPSPTSVPATPTMVPPSPTPPPPTPTPLPTISPETIKVSDYLPMGTEVVETVQADVDQDGTPELIVLFQVMEDDFPREAKALVFRQTPGGVAAHYLKGNLGDIAIGVSVRDTNKDGKPEIIIDGGAGAHYSVLNIYRWQDGTYRVIGAFGGDSGAWAKDQDGDGVEEILEGHRWYDRSQLWEDVTYRWSPKDDKYLEGEHRIGFTFGEPTLREYPEQIVLAYYLAIDEGRYSDAYSYLAAGYQATMPFDRFIAGFATTRQVDVNKLEVTSDTPPAATITVEFTAWDEVGGELAKNIFSGTWQTEKQAGTWKLAKAEIAPKG